MRSNSITLKTHNALILFATISILIFSSSIAYAENWGVVTIQSTHGYGSTIPINSGTINYLQKNGRTSKKYIADDTHNTRVSSVLNNLRDNDVLIINTHSNAEVFGVGSDGEEWAEFYNYWKTRKPPPKLGLVIIHGCIFNRDSQGNDTPATDRQIQDIRKSLNADAIISFNIKINPLAGRISLHQLIVNMLNDRKIASLIHGRSLRFLVDSQIDRDNVTLADIVAQQQFPPASSSSSGGNAILQQTPNNPEYCGRLVSKEELVSLRTWYKNLVKTRWVPKNLVTHNSLFSTNIYLSREVGRDRYYGNVLIWKEKVRCLDECVQECPFPQHRTNTDMKIFDSCAQECKRMKYMKCP